MRTSCKGCIHLKPLTSNVNNGLYCHYILDTGEPRGCPVENCTKYTDKEENEMSKGVKTTAEKKNEIITLRNEGKTIAKISKVTGVPPTTVTRICKKEEPAPSANDTSPKETSTRNIIPEISADVNPCDEVSDEDFCCEVTGDTDIEAYMADREKFFKEKRAVPEAVLEACRERRKALLQKTDKLLEEVKFCNEQIDVLTNFLKEAQG